MDILGKFRGEWKDFHSGRGNRRGIYEGWFVGYVLLQGQVCSIDLPFFFCFQLTRPDLGLKKVDLTTTKQSVSFISFSERRRKLCLFSTISKFKKLINQTRRVSSPSQSVLEVSYSSFILLVIFKISLSKKLSAQRFEVYLFH